MNTIMVYIGEHKWTVQALHLACALARNNNTTVTLVRMVPVQHTRWLGTEAGNTPPTSEAYELLREYQATAEDYGVELVVCSMQYATLADALGEAADHLDTPVVFATLPQSVIPYWRKFQLWMLEHHLAANQRRLYTLDQPTNVETWTPSVTLNAAK
jgi:nucleotide-binding universal stress UspA family protein